MTTVVITDMPIKEFFEQLQERISEHNNKYDGWYCINTRPIRCSGCGETVCYIEPENYHLIVVWEEKDDPHMLELAAFAKEYGAEPRIETYHPILGACISWDDCVRYNL